MGRFLTAHSRLEQLDIPEKWVLIDNQLYEDDDGQIYLCPRNTVTDGFTIPSIFTFIAGSKMKWDTRASSQHDFECLYHKCIKVLLPEHQLRKMRLLHTLGSMEVCEDIPTEYLFTQDTTFNETNDRFLRMLLSVHSIPAWRAKLLRFGVNFNVGWLDKPHHFDKNLIYKVNYELLA